MATAGTVVVSLIANTKSFQKGLKRSKLSMENFRKSVVSQRKAVSSVSLQLTGMFVKALGVAGAAIGGLIYRNDMLADSFAITGDIAVKYAESIGVSIQNLQRLQYAAEQTGSSSESLNKSFIRMIANLGDAAKGIGEAKESFEALNVNAQYLMSLTPDKAFLKIADAIQKVDNRTEAAAISYEIFGRKGVELVNMLSLGTDGLAKFGDEAESLGAIMTSGVAKGIADAKTQLDKYAAAQRGFEQSKAAALGGKGLISGVFKDMKAWWQTKGLTRKIYDAANYEDAWVGEAKVAKAAMEHAAAMEKLTSKTLEAAEAQKKLQVASELKTQKAGMKGFYDTLYDLKDKAAGIDDMTRALTRMDAEVGLTTEQYKKMKGVIDQINGLKAQISAQEEAKKLADKPLTTQESFTPTAREIDTSQVSIAGLSMSGKEYNYDKQQVNLLESINRNTRKTANQEVLN